MKVTLANSLGANKLCTKVTIKIYFGNYACKTLSDLDPCPNLPKLVGAQRIAFVFLSLLNRLVTKLVKTLRSLYDAE